MPATPLEDEGLSSPLLMRVRDERGVPAPSTFSPHSKVPSEQLWTVTSQSPHLMIGVMRLRPQLLVWAWLAVLGAIETGEKVFWEQREGRQLWDIKSDARQGTENSPSPFLPPPLFSPLFSPILPVPPIPPTTEGFVVVHSADREGNQDPPQPQ
ncbi:hypothetical protein P7K49_023286 [Saguinus oedipus]|uniref:Uncharacterized protein n=1 Tax=Saguinus oedipus TaxID=9490 RepID=A0ABQ9UL68_SAGOE|nr:hypothetical protein P7K49_023286 [Saguinus oedipus]